MQIEYEATFYPVAKTDIRTALATSGASQIHPERLMRRSTFNLPSPSKYRWARVRDEGDKVTMSVKDISGGRIEDQKEVMITISSFDEGVSLLNALGCTEKAYQETKRELWVLDGVEIMVDEWPFLEPFIEIEGSSEEAVRNVAQKLGFSWSIARFCAVDELYAERYGIEQYRINNETPRIVFGESNPFI